MFGADKAFDVEQGLIIFAQDYVQLPAFAIYDDNELAPLLDRIQACHLYLIGLLPKVDFEGASQQDDKMICHMKVLGKVHDVPIQLMIYPIICAHQSGNLSLP
ncbi:hypothetical protein AB9E15_11570 [Rhizobium leguminosarum]|uniref:hypothetical protein n=1 Tax=Rhizobium leguminosarum TaxID=384 RepID=UPI003F9B4171